MTFYFQLRIYSKQKGNALLRFQITRTMGLTNKQKVSLFLYLCYSFSFSLSTYTGGGSKTDLPLRFVS